jgi:FkbM family methyltransferase
MAQLINEIANIIRKIEFVRKKSLIYKLIRNTGIIISKSVFPKGIKKTLGGFGKYRFSHEFTFYDFDSWGKGKNNGFGKLVDLAVGKKVVLDIGAHIGLCTMPISRVLNECGRCYAFEPAKANIKFLKQHLKMNNINNVHVIESLVGDERSERVEFYEMNGDSGMNTISRVKKGVKEYRMTFKKQITIDGFVKEKGFVPDLIKIDVEGAEIKVLSGGEKVLKKTHPEIILSVHPKHIKDLGYSLDYLRKTISDLGYEIYNIDGTSVKDELASREYYLVRKCFSIHA